MTQTGEYSAISWRLPYQVCSDAGYWSRVFSRDRNFLRSPSPHPAHIQYGRVPRPVWPTRKTREWGNGAVRIHCSQSHGSRRKVFIDCLVLITRGLTICDTCIHCYWVSGASDNTSVRILLKNNCSWCNTPSFRLKCYTLVTRRAIFSRYWNLFGRAIIQKI